MATPKRLIDLDQRLIDAAAASIGTSGDNRATIDLGVRRYLPAVIERLKSAGLTARPTGRRKQRAVSDEAWVALRKAEAYVAADMIGLLRCCLVLAARGEGGRLDEHAHPDSHSVTGRIARNEVESQDRSTQGSPSDRVDPRAWYDWLTSISIANRSAHRTVPKRAELGTVLGSPLKRNPRQKCQSASGLHPDGTS